MKPKNLELILQAGFALSPKVENCYTGIDWSVASYGVTYNSCIENLIDIVRQDERKKFIHFLMDLHDDYQGDHNYYKYAANLFKEQT